jgi:hypothetical protein
MRKYFLIFAVLVLFFGCSNPFSKDKKSDDDVETPVVVEETEDPVETPVYVVNSAWQVVKTDTLKKSARAIESLDAIQAEVDAYNSTHTDDQWIILEDEVPPIEEAPEATLTIIFTDDSEVYATSTVERAKLEYERGIARSEIQTLKYNSGRETALYVDNAAPIYTPPYVEPVDNRPDYEKYAIYVIDAAGAILFEEHPPEGADLLSYFMGDATKTAKDWYIQRSDIFRQNWRNDFPTAVELITGRLYTAP